jgi:spore maturation protein CgeB
MKVVICGLSITSSWGNGHTVTFRALARALTRRGHDLLFLERDTPWYGSFRDDLDQNELGSIKLYKNLAELRRRYTDALRTADCIILGSFVPEGVCVARWLLANANQAVQIFYDLDTPVTLEKLKAGDDEYISARILPRFDYYLSFAGGAALEEMAKRYRVQNPITFWCTVDPLVHFPVSEPLHLGTGLSRHLLRGSAAQARTLFDPERPRDAWQKLRRSRTALSRIDPLAAKHRTRGTRSAEGSLCFLWPAAVHA